MFVIFWGFGALFVALLYATFVIAVGAIGLLVLGAGAVLFVVVRGVEAFSNRHSQVDAEYAHWCLSGVSPAARSALEQWNAYMRSFDDPLIGQRVRLRGDHAGLSAGQEGTVVGCWEDSANVDFAGRVVKVAVSGLEFVEGAVVR
ncbi:MAG: hypothetical protein KGL39_38190 [Patescibacteria group bacterium]|nr:hypothetical protein [Patescibacteria group bacterium]